MLILFFESPQKENVSFLIAPPKMGVFILSNKVLFEIVSSFYLVLGLKKFGGNFLFVILMFSVFDNLCNNLFLISKMSDKSSNSLYYSYWGFYLFMILNCWWAKCQNYIKSFTQKKTKNKHKTKNQGKNIVISFVRPSTILVLMIDLINMKPNTIDIHFGSPRFLTGSIHIHIFFISKRNNTGFASQSPKRILRGGWIHSRTLQNCWCLSWRFLQVNLWLALE